jgi:hypothetical protein
MILQYKLSIPGYTSTDLVNVTWNITGQGDIGTGYRFTFTEENVGRNSRHSFTIGEASVDRPNKTEVRRVKPNVNYRVRVTSDGGRVQDDPNKPFVDRDDFPGIQVGTLEEGKRDFKQLRNALVTNKKSNAAFADAVVTKNDSNDMRIVAFDVVILTPVVPELGEERGIVKKIIVVDPGNGYIPPNSPSPVPPVSVTITPGTPSIPPGTLPGTPPPGTPPPGTPPPGTPPPGTPPGIGISTTTTGTTTGTTTTGTPGTGIPPIPPSGPPTGINATFLPQFEVVRDPIVIDPQKLLQVTDLVGLKQTGYVNGRAYYGSVYYNRGIRYAGFYETVGEPVIVYDTLRESILAQITTPPSAILRQGTDIRSNDPLLNIPRTIQPTLNSNSIVGAGDYFPPSVPFTQEPTPGAIYSVSLRLSEVLVTDSGINYNVTDKIRITPSNGAILEPVFGSFGRVIKVAVIDPGFGFTEYPQIEMYTPL